MAWSLFGGNKRGNNSERRLRRKRMQHRCGRRRPLFEELEARHVLAVFTVTNLTDAAVAPSGSLRDAINQANATAGADTIQFASGLTGTLPLAAGAGNLSITDPLTIIGPGAANLTIDATAATSRVFNISDTAGNVTIKALTLTKGNPGGGNNGGAIFSESVGTLTVSDSVITGNQADQGGGIYATGDLNVLNSTIGGAGALKNQAIAGYGGGIYGLGNISITSSTISGNTASQKGGGIYALGTVNILNSTIGGLTTADGNVANGNGGGIFGQSVTVQSSAVTGNTSHNRGGGIYSKGMLSVQNSTLSGNSADDSGGGIYGFNVTLTDATIANNTANADSGVAGNGGGAFVSNSFKMQNSIVAGNSTLVLNTFPDLNIPSGNASKVKFSLIANNTGLPAGAQFTVTGPAGAPNSAGNIIGQPGGANAIALTDVFGAGGGTLAANGGPTNTIALLAGSIAINKGSNALLVMSGNGDQRGLPFNRVSPTGGSVDMGAFEFQTVVPNSPPVVANPIANQTATIDTFFAFTFPGNTFTDADGDPLTYSATLSGGGALPSWLTFNGTSRTFSGTPAASDIGAISLRVTANDGKGGSVSNDFTLTVVTNPPPVVSNPLPDKTATVSVPFSFTFAANTFTDPNGDPLTYSASKTAGGAIPAWLSFNPATRTFSGTPAAGDVGTVSIRVTANDGHGNTAFDDFNLTVSTSELPFSENFEGSIDSRITQQTPLFGTTTTNPLNGTTSYTANRQNVGDRPVSTVNFAQPTTASNITNVSVNVSTGGGNGTTLWNNAVIIFDYQSPTNYKFAGVFQIIHRLIIGQVVNGKVTYLAQKSFNAVANTLIPLSLSINHATGNTSLTSGSTSVAFKYSSIGSGTVGLGTINANATFDNLAIT